MEGNCQVVTPGELITSDSGFMRGHGTYAQNGSLYASIAGVVERVNKLVSVRPLRARYAGEIGDVVIGRILEIGGKRWRVDANSKQDSVLMLSSINLPGGIQRRKSEDDELQMRSFFAEGDILSAEVQSLYQDGAIGIHTRNFKYGKLVTGQLVAVQSALIRRSRSHFLVFPWGVEVILGMNGYVWVGKPRKAIGELDLDAIYSSELDVVSRPEREAIARTSTAIVLLDQLFHSIDEDSITTMYAHIATVPLKELGAFDPSTVLGK